MAIITISRGCFSHGKEVAERVAEMLGYKILSRETLIEEANQFYHVPEKELIKSIHDAPSVLGRLVRGREKYLSYIQARLLEYAKDDKLIYHGHASHLLLPEISHVFNVRIIAEMADRIAFMQQNQNISYKEAMQRINAEDANRARWAHYLYKADITDPCMYDMVINIKNLGIAEASQLICNGSQMESFRATRQSRQAVADLALSSRVKAAVESSSKPELSVEVTASSGSVHIRAQAPNIRKTGYAHPKTDQYVKETMQREIRNQITSAISGIEDIKNVVYDIIPPEYM
ncbi:MAG: cytidylate kinase-like family protein [Desulfosalsimonadaceae bacterium]